MTVLVVALHVKDGPAIGLGGGLDSLSAFLVFVLVRSHRSRGDVFGYRRQRLSYKSSKSFLHTRIAASWLA